MKHYMKVWISAVIGLVLATGVGFAEPGGDKTLSPYFFIEGGDPSVDRFPLKDTDVAVTINGVIAHVTVTQTYTNTGNRPIHARYIFPGSTRAAVHGMEMKIGEQVIKAKIKERETAQTEFEKAKDAGKGASLLKQERPNVFSMQVANILPGDWVDITLQYTELLVPVEGTYQFVYPTVVGPRYSNEPEADAPETDRWVKNPYLKPGDDPRTRFNIGVRISTGLSLQEAVCTSHDVQLNWENASTAVLTLNPAAPFGDDRDFILNYRLAGREIESGLMLYEGPEENFFLLMVQPPERVTPADIPPREYVFVVDVSGSMHGFPLNTAKTLLRRLIGDLKPFEKFNLILFSGASRLMAPASVPATPDNIDRAIRILDHARGGGGTELAAAMARGFALPKDEVCARSMLVITDGYISAEKEVFQLIRENLNRTNVFAFGIGTGVNRYLMEGMAKAGQGEPFVVTKPEEAAATATAFRTYVSAPVLTDISVTYDGFDAYDVQPGAFPDLFAQRPVIVFGKYRGKAEGSIRIKGLGGAGEYRKAFNVADTQPLESNLALPYLWARARLTDLADYGLGDAADEQKEEITALGLTYHLLTPYTAFIAVQEQIRNTGDAGENVNQPLPLPQHVSHLAVGGGVAKVPEPELFILLGLLGSLLLWKHTTNRNARRNHSR